MKKGLVLLLVSLSLGFSFDSFGQTVLLECGQNSGRNFNGWFIDSHQPFDAINFDDHSVTFEHWLGGNFQISLTTEIGTLHQYDHINLLFNFEVINDCQITDVVYYVSADNKNWEAINASRNNVAISVSNGDHALKYVRAVANAQFEEDGMIAFNYAKIEGEMDEIDLPVLAEIFTEPITDDFFIFNFEQNLNIETQSEVPYELLMTSIDGKIVYRALHNGSNRVQLPADLNGLFIVTIIQDNAFKASKKVMI